MKDKSGKVGGTLGWQWKLTGQTTGELTQERGTCVLHVTARDVGLMDLSSDEEFPEVECVRETQMKSHLLRAVVFCAADYGCSGLDDLVQAASQLWDALQEQQS